MTNYNYSAETGFLLTYVFHSYRTFSEQKIRNVLLAYFLIHVEHFLNKRLKIGQFECSFLCTNWVHSLHFCGSFHDFMRFARRFVVAETLITQMLFGCFFMFYAERVTDVSYLVRKPVKAFTFCFDFAFVYTIFKGFGILVLDSLWSWLARNNPKLLLTIGLFWLALFRIFSKKSCNDR